MKAPFSGRTCLATPTQLLIACAFSRTEPMHDSDMDVVWLAKAEDMSGCTSLSHAVQGLGNLGSTPQGKTTAWLRGLREASLDERLVDQLHGLPTFRSFLACRVPRALAAAALPGRLGFMLFPALPDASSRFPDACPVQVQRSRPRLHAPTGVSPSLRDLCVPAAGPCRSVASRQI